MKKNNLYKKIKRTKKRLLLQIKKHKTKLMISIFIIVFLLWTKIIYDIYINNDKNIVNKVYFDKYIIDNEQLTWMINDIEQTLLGVNSVKNKILWYESEKKSIYDKYKYIDNIDINLIDNNTIKVWLDFKKTKLNLIWSWKIYWIYGENLIKEFDIDNISWLNILHTWANNLYLPSYLYGKKLENIFFKIKLDTVLKYTNKIKEMFNDWKLYFLAWWESIKVETEDKIYFFSLTKDIQKQINQLNIAKQQVPSKVQKAQIIDLWNLETWIYLKENKIWK